MCHVEHDVHNSVPSDQLRALKEKAIARVRTMLEQRMAPIETQFLPPQHEAGFLGRSRVLTDLLQRPTREPNSVD